MFIYEESSMSSFKEKCKYFLTTKVLASPYFPDVFLLFIFFCVMLPRASKDFEIVFKSFIQKTHENDHLMMGCGKITKRKNKPYVLGLVGLPQTGKTTVSKILMIETGLIPVNSNLLRNWLVDAGRDYKNIDAIVLACMMYLLTTYDCSGVIMDSDCMSPTKRAFMNALVRHCGANIEYLEVTTAPSEWKSRLFAPGNVFHRMYKDGVHMANIKAGHVDLPVLPEHVRDCVIREWERQVPLHETYSGTFRVIGRIVNDGSLRRLKEVTRQLSSTIIL